MCLFKVTLYIWNSVEDLNICIDKTQISCIVIFILSVVDQFQSFNFVINVGFAAENELHVLALDDVDVGQDCSDAEEGQNDASDIEVVKVVLRSVDSGQGTAVVVVIIIGVAVVRAVAIAGVRIVAVIRIVVRVVVCIIVVLLED